MSSDEEVFDHNKTKMYQNCFRVDAVRRRRRDKPFATNNSNMLKIDNQSHIVSYDKPDKSPYFDKHNIYISNVDI